MINIRTLGRHREDGTASAVRPSGSTGVRCAVEDAVQRDQAPCRQPAVRTALKVVKDVELTGRADFEYAPP